MPLYVKIRIRRTAGPVMLAALLLLTGGCRTTKYDDSQRMDTAMPTDQTQILQTSSDSDELVTVALTLARSARQEDHALLLKHLQSADFLNRLDSAEDYDDLSIPPRIGRILQALQNNQAPSARDMLVALTQSPIFKLSSRRVDLLILACTPVRPAPPELIKFWDAYCQPVDGYTPLTVRALLDNGSEPAMALFEKKMLSPKHEDMDKRDWLHWDVLRHRDDLALLLCCERLLKGGLNERLQADLVEVLFDYRRTAWFGRKDDPPVPPPREKAAEEALKQLRKIGEYALKNVTLTESQKEVVESFMEATAPQ